MKKEYSHSRATILMTIIIGLITLSVNAQLIPANLMENCNQWKITYPDGVEEKTLCDDPNNEYFYVNSNQDAIVFKAPIRSDNGTTPNSSYIRSELREREADGSGDIYWTTEGSHMLYVKQAITHLPINKSHLVATQIHGNKADGVDDSMVLRLEGTHLFLSFNGGKLRSNLTIKSDYALGDIHEVIFHVIDGKHYCYYSEDGNLKDAYASGNASAYLVKDGSNDFVMDLNYDETYFKVGNYTQSNAEKEGSDTDDPNNYGEVLVYDFYVSHKEPDPVSVTGVAVSPATLTIMKGNSQQLSVSFTPSNATNKEVSFNSSNTLVASVNSNGVVSALTTGSAAITVTTEDGAYTATCLVTVTESPDGLSNLALSKPITTTVEPEASNPITNLVDGSTETRCSASGYPQTLEIDLGAVYSLSSTELVCYKDRAYQFIVEAAATKGEAYTQIVDRSSNSTGGTVDSPISDNFSPINARYVRITISGAGSYTGTWVSLLEFRVFGADSTEAVPITDVSLTPANVSLMVEESKQLSAILSPSNASYQAMVYSSSDSTIAQVNSNGVVTAISEGNVIITVTTVDGAFSSSSTISVSGSVNSDSAPYDIVKFQDYLAQCKFQAPESNTAATQNDIINGYTSEYFYVADTDKIAFYQTGSSKRSELRNLTNWYVSDGNQTLHSHVKIAEQTCEQVTFIQIHDDANAGSGPNKPLLRIYKSTSKTPVNHIWAAVKTDAGGVAIQHFDLGSDPGDYFDCDVSIESGNLIIEVNGKKLVNHDVSYWNYPSYWKNGVYLQDDGDAMAYFNELELTTYGVPVTGVSVSPESDTLLVGENLQLSTTISPSNATNQSLSYTGSNASVATVSENGLVTAIAEGSAIITVTTDDGGYTATSSIIVVNGNINVISIADNQNVKLYPNPASEVLSLEFENMEDVSSVKIYSSLGKLVHAQSASADIEKIDISHLDKGFYFLVIQGTRPIVKPFSVE